MKKKIIETYTVFDHGQPLTQPFTSLKEANKWIKIYGSQNRFYEIKQLYKVL